MRRGHIAITLAAASLLAAAPPPAKPDTTVQAVEKTHAEWEGCVADAASKYDDRTSDVMSVAAAIQSMCSTDYIKYILMFPRGPHDISVFQQARDTRDEVTREIAAKVLMLRAEHSVRQ
ncbi:MAG: hypothetical protein ABSC06_37300 [Rhodopila sp.]|jgi:hypothetical protein